eukprot:gene17046-23441_t
MSYTLLSKLSQKLPISRINMIRTFNSINVDPSILTEKVNQQSIADSDLDIDGHLPLHPRVYVYNLSYRTKWHDLKDHMKAAGNVNHARIIQDIKTRKSKGCGIVEFSSPREAVNAVRILNGSVLNGRRIRVSEQRVATSVVGTKVYVDSISCDTQWQELKDHMRAAGNVIRADILEDGNGNSRGFAIVEYSTIDEAQRAISTLNDSSLDGSVIHVREEDGDPYSNDTTRSANAKIWNE